MNYSSGIQTQKRKPKQGLYFIDNLETNTLNHSMTNMKKLYNTQNPYTNYLNYSKTVTGSSSNNAMFGRPYINENSKRIANSKKTSNISVYDRLHQQALSKQKIEKREGKDQFIQILT